MTQQQYKPRREVSPAIQLCCFYHPEDEMYHNELTEHFAALIRQDRLEIWNPHKMLPGVVRKHEINVRLSSSDIILFLASRYFFSSDPLWDIMEQSLELHHLGKIHIVPVCARPYDYLATPLGDLELLPRKKPLSRLPNRDEGYVEIAEGVRKIMLKLRGGEERGSELTITAHEPIQETESFSIASYSPSFFIEKGDILFKQKRYDEALASYNKAIHLDLSSLIAYQRKAQVLESIRAFTYEQLDLLAVQSSERMKPQDIIQEGLE